MLLSGYGVELAIKSTEYKAVDDTKVKGQLASCHIFSAGSLLSVQRIKTPNFALQIQKQLPMLRMMIMMNSKDSSLEH